ncbi:type I restriction enzyme HsdR N-terminal domain-containing protein [Desulfobacterales bacterium HSG16]|nr:type I restriction enzyme HsdR N-terminal domain-containing protein [Desulfobacterales bacterium HSG16]
MTDNIQKQYNTIVDFASGKNIPDIGAEANRQEFERFLVDQKGYEKEDIKVDVPVQMDINGEIYESRIDLVLIVENTKFAVIKCAAGSLGSREREILAAARLLDSVQIPFCAVTDGKTALLRDTVSGKKIGEGLDAFFSKDEAIKRLKEISSLQPLPEGRVLRERLIFRTYDSMNVNRLL